MARGRKTSLTIHLTPEERRTLLTWQRAINIRAGPVRRARMILLLADGVSITDVAATVGISRRDAYNPTATLDCGAQICPCRIAVLQLQATREGDL